MWVRVGVRVRVTVKVRVRVRVRVWVWIGGGVARLQLRLHSLRRLLLRWPVLLRVQHPLQRLLVPRLGLAVARPLLLLAYRPAEVRSHGWLTLLLLH